MAETGPAPWPPPRTSSGPNDSGGPSGPGGSGGARKPRRGDELEVALTDLDERGWRVGEAGEYRVRVRHGVPGARVRARVLKRRRNDVRGHVLETLDPGPWHVEPRCAHHGVCGGCSFQDLEYAEQLRLLGARLERQVRALPGGEAVRVHPVLGCDDPWAYRNKMDFTFGSRRFVEPGEPANAPADFALGLHAPGRFDKVLDVRACSIQFRAGDAILGTVRELARERGLAPWDVRAHAGLLRHLVLRRGAATGEILVLLVTSEPAPERIEPFAAEVVRRHPEITTFVQAVHDGAAAVATGAERVLFGPGAIHEELLGLRFELSAQSFFQTNTSQAERLFELVRDAVAPAGGPPAGAVWDLYCGAGAIALLLADRAREVVGFEEVPAAVRDAERNAAANGVSNVRFLRGDVLTRLAPDALEAAGLARPDTCVVDPPRAGLHPGVVTALARLGPARIVYVSCNPKSAVRDLAALGAPRPEASAPDASAVYRVRSARPVDLFPHTPHLECVFVLEREDAP